jgi:hypothetical protein
MIFFIKGILHIRDINTVAEKYSRLYKNLFIFRIYNMGLGKEALSSILEHHLFKIHLNVTFPAPK